MGPFAYPGPVAMGHHMMDPWSYYHGQQTDDYHDAYSFNGRGQYDSDGNGANRSVFPRHTRAKFTSRNGKRDVHRHYEGCNVVIDSSESHGRDNDVHHHYEGCNVVHIHEPDDHYNYYEGRGKHGRACSEDGRSEAFERARRSGRSEEQKKQHSRKHEQHGRKSESKLRKDARDEGSRTKYSHGSTKRRAADTSPPPYNRLAETAAETAERIFDTRPEKYLNSSSRRSRKTETAAGSQPSTSHKPSESAQRHVALESHYGYNARPASSRYSKSGHYSQSTAPTESRHQAASSVSNSKGRRSTYRHTSGHLHQQPLELEYVPESEALSHRGNEGRHRLMPHWERETEDNDSEFSRHTKRSMIGCELAKIGEKALDVAGLRKGERSGDEARS